MFSFCLSIDDGARRPLGRFVRHYEHIHYDKDNLMHSHHRLRRSSSGEKELKLSFSAFDRSALNHSAICQDIFGQNNNQLHSVNNKMCLVKTCLVNTTGDNSYPSQQIIQQWLLLVGCYLLIHIMYRLCVYLCG